MARDILLDTGVIVGIQRGQLRPQDAYRSTDDPAIAALTATELLVGVELAPADRQQVKRQKIDDILGGLYIFDYDLKVARAHALLLAHATRTGRPRGAFDLAIAATAVAHRRVLITTDGKARFDDLPGLEVEVVGHT